MTEGALMESRHTRNSPMGPVGRITSNFENHGDQVYLVPCDFCNCVLFIRWAVSDACSASPDLLAEFKEKRKEECRERNGWNLGGAI